MKTESLNKELAKVGAPTDYAHLGRQLTPLEALVNGPFSAKPYVKILVRYLTDSEVTNKDYIARALTERGLTDASGSLIALFADKEMSESELWAVGNALYVIDDKTTYKEIREISRRGNLGVARQMLLGTLARSKDEDSYTVLIDCLKDDSVRGHAIEALGRFGSTAAIVVIENTEVEKGKYEFKAKQTALRRLRKIKEKTAANIL